MVNRSKTRTAYFRHNSKCSVLGYRFKCSVFGIAETARPKKDSTINAPVVDVFEGPENKKSFFKLAKHTTVRMRNQVDRQISGRY